MKLSVYLVRENVTDFDKVLQAKHLKDDGFVEITQTRQLPYECKAFVQSNKAKPPRWASYLGGHFDTESLGLLNQSNSFLLLIRVAGRIFAVTFGYGFTAIDRSKIEPRFGLMAAANSLDAARISTLETNLVDAISRNRRTHISMGSSFAEFDINPRMDWIRKISGKPKSSKLAKSISGSDSVCVGVDCTLAEVGDKCGELLVEFESEKYKESFRYLDNLWPINKNAPEVVDLDKELVAKLGARSHDRIAIAFPEIPDEELLDHFKVYCHFEAADLEELGLAGIYKFMDDSGLPPEPSQINIVGIGDNDQPVTKSRSLREYLVCEVDRGDDTFIFCVGQWFRANKDYVQQVRAEVAALDDLTGSLDLIQIRNDEREEHYNQRVADDRGWLVLDKVNFQIRNSHDKIEICDVLTEAKQFLCVKKMDRSATLSHLFSQGSVSATLLREHDGYRKATNDALVGHWPTATEIGSSDLGGVTFVYALATRREEPLSTSMFFFSLVNLLNHVRAIRRVGCNVAICRIGYEADPAVPTKTTRKKAAKTAKAAAGSAVSPTKK